MRGAPPPKKEKRKKETYGRLAVIGAECVARLLCDHGLDHEEQVAETVCGGLGFRVYGFGCRV